jgi:hypothetical protein
MSKYLVLIYGDEQVYADGGQGLWDDVMKGHMAFSEKHGAKVLGGEALQTADTSTSIRPDTGGFAVTDGPFVETKEALGGYYVVEAADLDEAISMAKDIPMPGGGVEVRPVMVFDR